MKDAQAALEQMKTEPKTPDRPLVRLGDKWVGQENTAPPGQMPWWVANRPFEFAHLAAP